MLDLEKKYRDSLSSFRFIDLFAGIGGFHLALSSFGAECIFASEWDSYAQSVYEKNFGIKPNGDITKIEESEVPEHNIICAGFPCQAFSISGKQNGFNDTRGTLFFEIIRIAKFHSPELLILENVANFEKHDNGRTLQVVVDSLDNLGYDVYFKVLNASFFGVPQSRERIYFVCFRKNLDVKNFKFPDRDGHSIFIKDILLDDKEIDESVYLNRKDIYFNGNKINEKELFSINRQKPLRLGIVNKGGQGERIYDIHGHAITLSAYGGGVGSKTGLYLINGRVRKLLPKECSRIQGFPDDFKISESSLQAYKQFGTNSLKKISKAA